MGLLSHCSMIVRSSLSECLADDTWVQVISYLLSVFDIFQQLIKIKFPTDATVQPANQCSVDLTFEEASGLRYAAGYV